MKRTPNAVKPQVDSRKFAVYAVAQMENPISGMLAGMDWIAAAAEWKYFRNVVRAHWLKLSDHQLEAIAGRRAMLGEQICISYGLAPAQAERQICGFEASNDEARPASSR